MSAPLTPEQAAALGLPPPKSRRKLSADEATKLGLPPPKSVPTSGQKHDTSIEDSIQAISEPTHAALDSASLGILPRALAAGDALSQVADPRGPKVSEIGDLYDSNLTSQQNNAEKRARENPSASLTGAFLPNLIPGLQGSGAAPELSLMGKTALQRLAAAGGLGALSGNLSAPHANDKARLEGSLVGGLSGAGMQALGELPAAVTGKPMLARLYEKLRGVAGQQATNVAGGGRGQIGDRLAKVGVDPREQADFGNQLLDKGLIPSGLNPLESPAEGVLNRADALHENAGDRIGAALRQADATGKPVDNLTAQMNVRDGMIPADPLDAANSKKANKLVEQIGQLGSYPGGQTFEGANAMKAKAWKAAQFKDSAPLEAQRYRQANGMFRDEIADQVRGAAGPEVAEQLGQGNADYGLAEKVRDLAGPAVSRGGQEQKFKTAAAAMADPTAAAGLAAGSLLKARGPAFLANASRQGSDIASYFNTHSNSPAAAGAAGGDLSRYLTPKVDDAADKLQSMGKAAGELAPSLAASMGGLQALRDKSRVDVKPLEPTITSRKPATVDVQALPPTQMVTTHQPLSPEEEEQQAQARRMKLARMFGGGGGNDVDELQLQR